MKPLSSLALNLVFLVTLLLFSGDLLCQTLWGMAYDGGSKLTGGNIFSLNTNGSGFKEHFAFKGDEQSIGLDNFLDGGDGFIYGTLFNVNTQSAGIFRLHPDGSAYEIIHEFDIRKGNDYLGGTGLVKGPDGFIYGAVPMGGSLHAGVIYKLKPDGTQYQVIYNFNYSIAAEPAGQLSLTQDGYLVGSGLYEPINNNYQEGGCIYKVKTDGSGFQVLHIFSKAEGTEPEFGTRVVTTLGSTKVYGLTVRNGPHDHGSLFKVNLDGTGFQVLHSDMTGNFFGLTSDANNIYFTETDGGTGGKGSIWKQNITFGTAVRIADLGTELIPGSGKVMGDAYKLILANGVLYSKSDGLSGYPKGCIFKLDIDGSNPAIIWNINTPDVLIHCLNGRVYGAFNSPTPQDKNTLYSVSVNGGDYKTVHVFESPDGCYPAGGLISDGKGKLLGLASYGGTQIFLGVAFQFDPVSDQYALISNFSYPYSWSGRPLGSMMKASDGSFYFTKQSNINNGWGGDIGKVTQGTFSNGLGYTSYQQLNDFDKEPDRIIALNGTLTEGTDGYLYGTAGYSHTTGDLGCVYKASKTGSVATVLHGFTGSSDGANPTSALTKGPDGYLYGMTENGGLQDYGTIFKISNTGTKINLFQFGSGTGMYSANGVHPKGALLFGKDGKIYGMTSLGGNYLQGVIFRININGSGYEVLNHFNGVNGAQPQAGLIQDSTGTLYGMTMLGGNFNMGTIFRIASNGAGFQKLVDFNGTKGKFPKGDLFLYSAQIPAAALKISRQDNSFEEYPNPVTSTMTFKIVMKKPGKLEYRLLDANGIAFRRGEEYTTSTVFEKVLNVPEIAAGTYFLEVVTDDARFIKTLIKR